MKKILLTLFAVFCALASFSQGQVSGLVFYVTDSATYRSSTTITNAHSQGKADQCWNAQATTPHWDFWTGAAYEHVFTFGSGGGGGHTIEEEGSPLTQRTKLNFVGAGVTATDDSGDDATVVTIPNPTINTSSALTDGAAITITGSKHTLTSDEATITWTLSQLSDFQTTDIIINTVTSTVWTFPANTLCVVDGVASGDNTATLANTSGDHHIMSIYKDGTNYRVVIKNFGQ